MTRAFWETRENGVYPALTTTQTPFLYPDANGVKTPKKKSLTTPAGWNTGQKL